jgi:predicted nuclease of predicted toxin-antitoxin system
LMAVSGAAQPSVIRVRIEGLVSEQLATLLCGILRSFDEELREGVLMTVQPARVRIRRLPLARG